MMNVYKLSVAGINVSEGLNRFGGNKTIYEKYLKKFLDDPNYALLCESIDNKSVTTAFMAAHSLKGLAGNLSISKLYEDICPLVEELRSGSLIHAEELCAKVKIDYDAIKKALE